MAVHLSIPLCLPLRNAVRQPINRRSIATSAPLLPAKAIEGAGAVLLLRLQCCNVAAAVVSHERFRTIATTIAAVLLLRTPIGTEAVATTAVLRWGPRDITAGAAAATTGWKLHDISSGIMTRFRAQKRRKEDHRNSSKRTLGSLEASLGQKEKSVRPVHDTTKPRATHVFYPNPRGARSCPIKLSHRPSHMIVHALSMFELHSCLLRCVCMYGHHI